jgi:hypothetical protein
MAEGYSIKDMQQIMMSEQKAQREILEHQTATLNGISQHLATLNGKVARHQESLYEKERGLLDRLVVLETFKTKIMGAAVLGSSLATILVQVLFKLFL